MCCWPLHHVLEVRFPEEYRARLAEQAHEESTRGVSSPDPPPASGLADPYACSACGSFCAEPSVLNCGHVVCARPCLFDLVEGSQRCPHPGCGLPVPKVPRICQLLQTAAREDRPAAYSARLAEVLDLPLPSSSVETRFEASSPGKKRAAMIRTALGQRGAQRQLQMQQQGSTQPAGTEPAEAAAAVPPPAVAEEKPHVWWVLAPLAWRRGARGFR